MNDFHEKKNLITICYTVPINHFSDLNSWLSNLKSFNRPVASGGGRAQCVELELRWQFCVHSSTCPKIIFLIKVLNNFWYFEHPILTMIYSEAYLKHNWRNCPWKSKKVQFMKTISSIILQICFWASPSKNSVFEISKMIQNFD